jgi:hypothetical protein
MGTATVKGQIPLISNLTGGWGGIRTHETVARLPVFKTGAFNHSATHPAGESSHYQGNHGDESQIGRRHRGRGHA